MSGDFIEIISSTKFIAWLRLHSSMTWLMWIEKIVRKFWFRAAIRIGPIPCSNLLSWWHRIRTHMSMIQCILIGICVQYTDPMCSFAYFVIPSPFVRMCASATDCGILEWDMLKRLVNKCMYCVRCTVCMCTTLYNVLILELITDHISEQTISAHSPKRIQTPARATHTHIRREDGKGACVVHSTKCTIQKCKNSWLECASETSNVFESFNFRFIFFAWNSD